MMHKLTVVDRRRDQKFLFEFMHGEPEFNVLSEEEVELLDKIMLVQTYKSGYTFKSDDNIYLLIDGDVIVTHKKMRAPLHYEHMRVGEFFDLFSLVENRKHSAECIAVGSVRAASLPRTVFELIIKANISLSFHFRQIITKQIRHYFSVSDSAVCNVPYM